MPPSDSQRISKGTLAALCLGGSLVALGFLLVFAFPFLMRDEAALSRFAGARWWILLHVSSGSIALVLATVLLWRLAFERDQAGALLLRAAYCGSVTVSWGPGLYLAVMLDGEVWYAAGITGLAVAWGATTGLGAWTLIRGRTMHHNRWLLRSCVVTFAFVFFAGWLYSCLDSSLAQWPTDCGSPAGVLDITALPD